MKLDRNGNPIFFPSSRAFEGDDGVDAGDGEGTVAGASGGASAAAAAGAGQRTEERKFTQEQLNEIVEKRLSRERQKWEGKVAELEKKIPAATPPPNAMATPPGGAPAGGAPDQLAATLEKIFNPLVQRIDTLAQKVDGISSRDQQREQASRIARAYTGAGFSAEQAEDLMERFRKEDPDDIDGWWTERAKAWGIKPQPTNQAGANGVRAGNGQVAPKGNLPSAGGTRRVDSPESVDPTELYNGMTVAEIDELGPAGVAKLHEQLVARAREKEGRPRLPPALRKQKG
jgi:hypothetical protein